MGYWRRSGMERRSRLQVCIDTIVEAHRCGINLIDTAPGYNFGNSEVIVGQALKKLPRNDIVVETKCGIVWGADGQPV